MGLHKEVYCEEILHWNHEEFYCGELKGHSGKHTVETGSWPPCKECFGIDEHSQKCSQETGTGKINEAVRIEWLSGDKPKIKRVKYW